MNKFNSLILFLFFIYCKPQQAISQPVNSKNDLSQAPQNKPVLKIKIFKNDTLKDNSTRAGFGFDIFSNGTLYIHQPGIPAIAGNKGFNSAADANKTANLMVYKVQNNIMPPSISKEELDSMGVLIPVNGAH